MKGTCKLLGGIIIVLGGIGTIVLAVAGGKTADYGMYSIHYERSWLLTIGYLLGGGLSTAFTATVFFALAEILEMLEGVKYFQKEVLSNFHAFEQRNLTAGNASESEDASYSNATSSIYGINGDGGWTCPECNKRNRSFETTCSCGYYKG